jgi:hypothetical protein
MVFDLILPSSLGRETSFGAIVADIALINRLSHAWDGAIESLCAKLTNCGACSIDLIYKE